MKMKEKKNKGREREKRKERKGMGLQKFCKISCRVLWYKYFCHYPLEWRKIIGKWLFGVVLRRISWKCFFFLPFERFYCWPPLSA
jgi:hypothetical protein